MIATPIEAEGLVETLAAFKELEADLRRTANGELRAAAKTAAGELVGELRAAAGAGPPVARRVARTIRVKNDRIPAVQIGGARKVGATGAPASLLMWGSEHGPGDAADVNRFGVARNVSGYWIAPTVKRFGASAALTTYKRALIDLLRKHKLL
jgi:hypothetical protein